MRPELTQNKGTPAVKELRRKPRFLFSPAIQGFFGSTPLRIHNIGEEGVQAQPGEELWRGEEANLRFTLPLSDREVKVHARIVWRRRHGNSEGLPFPYRVGIKMEGIHRLTLQTVTRLLEIDALRPDTKSLQRKREILLNKARSESIHLDAGAESALTLGQSIERVNSARRFLRDHPDQMAKYIEFGQRAQTSPATDGIEVGAETLAAWAYLEYKMPLKMVLLIFDFYSEPVSPDPSLPAPPAM